MSSRSGSRTPRRWSDVHTKSACARWITCRSRVDELLPSHTIDGSRAGGATELSDSLVRVLGWANALGRCARATSAFNKKTVRSSGKRYPDPEFGQESDRGLAKNGRHTGLCVELVRS